MSNHTGRPVPIKIIFDPCELKNTSLSCKRLYCYFFTCFLPFFVGQSTLVNRIRTTQFVFVVFFLPPCQNIPRKTVHLAAVCVQHEAQRRTFLPFTQNYFSPMFSFHINPFSVGVCCVLLKFRIAVARNTAGHVHTPPNRLICFTRYKINLMKTPSISQLVSTQLRPMK